MAEIVTQRCTLAALTEAQLRLSLSHPEQLTASLGCSLADGAFSEASRRAIYVKLEKMEPVSAQLHIWYTYWLIILKETGVGVGLVGFKGAPDSSGEAEIGYGIAPDFQGHGYMTEAVQGIVSWAFQQPGCTSIRAETLRNNIASHRVLQKSGFLVTRETQLEIYWRIRKLAPVNQDQNDLYQAGP